MTYRAFQQTVLQLRRLIMQCAGLPARTAKILPFRRREAA